MRIVNCCNNLNYQPSQNTENLGEEVTTQFTVTSSSTLILPANPNRRIVKIHTISFSDRLTKFWIRYGTSVSLLNAAHPIPLDYLLIEKSQAMKAISGICSVGSALLRVSVVEKV